MSRLLHPVGPERRTTYWRRRLVVVLVLLVLVAVVTALVRGLGSDEDAGTAARDVLDPATVTPAVPAATAGTAGVLGAAPTTDPATTDAATPSAPVACSPAQLTVATATDAPVYGPDVSPQLKVLVQNTAASGCEARVGAGTRTLVVRDAAGAQVWSSADCDPSSATTTVALLARGQQQGDDSDTSVMTQRWSGARSAPGCPDGLPAAEPGVYTLTGTWNGAALPPASFSLMR